MASNDIKTFASTFQGRRNCNQDSFLILEENPNIVFIAVADGMGGVGGGEKASNLVIECCKKIIKDSFSTDGKDNEGKLSLKQILRNIFIEAQKTIREEIQKNPNLNGMGTTLSCVLIEGDKYVWGNIGDSRIYHFNGSELRLITKDHTYVQEFLEKNNGQVPRDIVKNYSNFLTRAIDGGNDEGEIFPDDTEYLELKDGEAFLICSDGLILDKSEDNSNLLKNFIIGTNNLEEASKKLIKMAYESGSTDNITVVLLEKGSIKRNKVIKEKTKYYGTNYGMKPKTGKSKKYKVIPNKISFYLGSMIILLSTLIFILIYQKNTLKNNQILLNSNQLNSKNENTFDDNKQFKQDVSIKDVRNSRLFETTTNSNEVSIKNNDKINEGTYEKITYLTDKEIDDLIKKDIKEVKDILDKKRIKYIPIPIYGSLKGQKPGSVLIINDSVNQKQEKIYIIKYKPDSTRYKDDSTKEAIKK